LLHTQEAEIRREDRKAEGYRSSLHPLLNLGGVAYCQTGKSFREIPRYPLGRDSTFNQQKFLFLEGEWKCS
jgi:hypothetical protein